MVKKKNKRVISNGIIHVNSTPNNIIITLCDLEGNAIMWTSAGLIGFSGVKKKTPHAAQVTADKFSKIMVYVHKVKRAGLILTSLNDEINEIVISIFKKYRLKIESIENRTPISYNGCRKPKKRRL